jgi:ribosomal-protein-alanine N-acetyltransferase
LLEGNLVNLRVLEKEDLLLLAEWNNDPEFGGECEPLEQSSYAEFEKWYNGLRPEEKWFIIEKKGGTKIGQLLCSPKGPHYSIGYRILPAERNKGYCTEAVKIIVDYLFLTQNIVRIESETSPKNTASSRVLEKAGFTNEGLIRKSVFIRGKWQDGVLYSILREEWNEPRMLTKATPQE